MQIVKLFSPDLTVQQSVMSPKIGLFTTKEGQNGVITNDSFVAGEIVVVFVGKIISLQEFNNLSVDMKRYMLQIDDSSFLGWENKEKFDAAEFINHSCNPNCGIMGNNILVAMRDIKKGEEITFDYAMTDTTDGDVGTWKCNCGSKECRKIITPNDWQIPELQKKYGNFFSRYILEKIQKQKSISSSDKESLSSSQSATALSAFE